MRVSREQVLAFRMGAQQLDGSASTVAGTAILDLGVQDTGTDGGHWALAVRGAPVAAASGLTADLVLAWTLCLAPHFYRRKEAAAVAAATAPWSEADAAKRIFDASKPLREAGIPVDEALVQVAKEMRSIVTKPTAKGDLSTASHQAATGAVPPVLPGLRGHAQLRADLPSRRAAGWVGAATRNIAAGGSTHQRLARGRAG